MAFRGASRREILLMRKISPAGRNDRANNCTVSQKGKGFFLIPFLAIVLSHPVMANDSLIVSDSLPDTSAVVPVDTTGKVSHQPASTTPAWSSEIHGALLWSIYDLSQIKDWEGAVNADLQANGVRIDRGFESFNNGFSPALGIGLRSPKGRLFAEMQAQFLWISKKVTYSSLQSDSSRIGGHEAIRLRSIPLVFNLSTAISESLFSVQGFERVEAGLCAVAVPWAWLSVDGNRQPSFSATGHGFGFGLRLAIGRKIGPRLLYRGELRFFSTSLSSFDGETGGRLLASQLAGGTSHKPFSLDQQILQFQIQIVFGKFGETKNPRSGNARSATATMPRP